MDNNQWNQHNNQWNGGQNQWNGNQQANQWNGNQNQNYYNQQGYNNQPPLGQQVDLQQQYQQQQMYGAPVPQKKKGPGCLIAVIVAIIVVILGVVGILKLFGIGNDKDNGEATKEGQVYEEVIEDKDEIEDSTETLEVETPEVDVETKESTEESQVQLDEIVQGKIPTTKEFADVLKSLEFNMVYDHKDSATSSTLDVDYQVYDNSMSALIKFEAIVETVEDQVKAKHSSEEKHFNVEVLYDKEYNDGQYRVLKVKRTNHNKNCEVVDYNTIHGKYFIDVYVLKHNTILDYEYETDEANLTNSTVKTFEKALEVMEYVTIEKEEIIEAPVVEETTEENVTNEVTEENVIEETTEDPIEEIKEATEKINEIVKDVENVTETEEETSEVAE